MQLKTRQQLIFFSFIFLIIYFLGVSLRLWEWQFWNNRAYFLDGEPLMATHDAYAWLAGAIETGRLTNFPLSLILKYLHLLTGINVATLNFWLPVFIAPLACLPIIFICKIFDLEEAGLLAGAVAILGPGYLLRTRIGYGDTDILTIFLPLSYCAGLIYWLHPLLTSFKKDLNPKRELKPKESLYPPFITGLILSFYHWFYPSAYPIIMYTFIFTLVLTFFLLPKSTFTQLLPGFVIILSLGLTGIIGLILTLLFVYLFYFKPSTLNSKKILNLYFIFFLILFFFKFKLGGILKLIEPVIDYAKIFPFFVSEEYVLKLPSVKQSIREAQNVDFMGLVRRVGISPYIFFPGLIGFAFSAYFRPVLLVFLPQLVLALLSFKLGNRFTMYGPYVIGLGLALGLAPIFSKIKIKPLILYLILTTLLVIPITQLAKKFRPNPVLPKIYASSLKELASITPKSSQLWQWWDYGYAAQYYGQRKSFGDGGAHSGPYLYPLALVHTTSSPLQANQFMKYVALDMQEQILEMQKNGTKPQNPGSKVLYWPVKVLKKLNELGPNKAQEFIASLKTQKLAFPQGLPEQYLTLSWENLNLSYWISYFGNWDIVTGTTNPGKIKTLWGNLKINLNQGIVAIQDQKLPILKMIVIDKQGKIRELKWARPKGLYLIFNQVIGQIKAMDKTIYDSLMVKMLLLDPKLFEPYFELVIDRAPWVRVYKIK